LTISMFRSSSGNGCDSSTMMEFICPSIAGSISRQNRC
jgi:hypothetical protein